MILIFICYRYWFNVLVLLCFFLKFSIGIDSYLGSLRWVEIILYISSNIFFSLKLLKKKKKIV